MSEFNIVNVSEIRAEILRNPRKQKTLLAMQATKSFVENDMDGFGILNKRLLVMSGVGAPPSLTYEDLIFENGNSYHIYVMSDDEAIAQSEVQFYETHQKVEAQLDLGVKNLIVSEEPQETAIYVRQATDVVLELYDQLSPEHFGAMRSYFVGINDFPGPSGLYTAAIPILDLLVHNGNNISTDQQKKIKSDLRSGLYPLKSRQFVGSQLLSSLVELEDASLPLADEQKLAITLELDRFRDVHRACVLKFVPEAMTSSGGGTGGITEVASFLRSKLIRPTRRMK